MKKNPDFPIVLDDTCPLNVIILMPEGSTTKDVTTGRVLKAKPGYYVNPHSIARLELDN